MALADTLNTNEIKDKGATEVEFTQRSEGPGAQTEFKLITELPYSPHRFTVKHQEAGSGADLVRTSAVQFTKTVIGTSGVPRKCLCLIKLTIPCGDLATFDDPKNVLAEAGSFVYTTDGSTFIHAGTGTGATALINGTI